MTRPSYLAKAEPYDALCQHFNVIPPQAIEESIPETYELRVTQATHLPTHVLAATLADPSSSPKPPLFLPIDANLFAKGFTVDTVTIPSNSPSATPSTSPGGSLVITLPVIPISVLHLPSLPLLLLYGMGLETQHNALAWRLLPSQVIEEFPNAATMAQILSRARPEQFDRIFLFNQGLWRNILSLGVQDSKVIELVQTAWNVTAEARKIRQRSVSGITGRI
ncbi:hypothetical protein CC1G_13523 [Coprinopsis cinerea okayama7|uniref:Clp1 n=1 Tax=Coprinopsis cinerea (strain Okayama-7 / 130 / ATCC MYA-4618 / FGSC 9003) TaxID=240176 RepID=A8P058_COPC7|nr:hypothetical protein CC1G_15563 [Coprinopsis cinerea okayama7\|eukprot:XP_001837822.1 hypothetical protein CC1G_15563 [Coprinopsis cinerea okayama7\